MSEHETAQAINERAAEWVARVDRSGADQAVQAELNAWLAGDDRRRGAYFRSQIAWQMLDRASVLARGDDHLAKEGPFVSRRGLLWGGGALASSLAVTFAGLRISSRASEQIETAVGEIRRLPLPDGSLAVVNTQTRMAVVLRPDSRLVSLDRGEAWFAVAKDRARPFVVEAGDVRVRAVGTAFSVRKLPYGVDVQVTEGVVEVWNVGDIENVGRVSAGSRTFVQNGAGPQKPPEISTNIEQNLAWRTGQVIFDGETLERAATEFNRYNTIQVAVRDATLGQEKIVGRFRIDEPEAFANAAASMFGAQAIVGADSIEIVTHLK